jgi:hypothetical protein
MFRLSRATLDKKQVNETYSNSYSRGSLFTLHNAYSTGRYCVADFCARMAEGHAQKEVKQYFSCGYTC